MQRFTEALTLMTGAPPPADMCQEWVDHVQVNHVDRLQAWVLAQDKTPLWAMGITTIEAAEVWADAPTECVLHGRKPEAKKPQ